MKSRNLEVVFPMVFQFSSLLVTWIDKSKDVIESLKNEKDSLNKANQELSKKVDSYEKENTSLKAQVSS